MYSCHLHGVWEAEAARVLICGGLRHAAHLKSGMLSNVSSALCFLWVIVAALSSCRGSGRDEALAIKGPVYS